MMEFQNIF